MVAVLTIAADVTDCAQMQAVLQEVRKRFGALHGVVHAAGTLDDTLMQLKEPDSALGVIAPKVQGALLLDELLAGEQLDFFILCSSVSSVLGLQGQVDYTAANAFLDAFARHRAQRCSGPTVAIAGGHGRGRPGGPRCPGATPGGPRAVGLCRTPTTSVARPRAAYAGSSHIQYCVQPRHALAPSPSTSSAARTP